MGTRRTKLRGKVVEGCCETSPEFIGELINGASYKREHGKSRGSPVTALQYTLVVETLRHFILAPHSYR